MRTLGALWRGGVGRCRVLDTVADNHPGYLPLIILYHQKVCASILSRSVAGNPGCHSERSEESLCSLEF